jgi:lysylphosphatidylglycerol synthetase-like protein (DUF2156 family)
MSPRVHQVDPARRAGDDDAMTPRWLVRARWTGWRRELGWVLVALSLLAPCVTFALFSFARLPYQDPTPVMLAQQAREIHQANVLETAVGTIALVCFAAGVWLIVWARRRARRPAQPGS